MIYILKFSKKNTFFLFALSVYLNAFFCMMWKTYLNGILYLPLTLLSYASIAIFIFFALRENHIVQVNDIIIIIFMIAFYAQTCLLAYKNTKYFSVQLIATIFSVIALCALKQNERDYILKNIIVLFIVFSLPSIVYFLLTVIGIHLPHSILFSPSIGKSSLGMYYLHFPLGLVINDTVHYQLQPCGMFDEPGVIGTYAGLLFSITAKNKALKKSNIILFLIGFFSTSLAFYVILIIYGFVRLIQKGMIKFSVLLIVCVVAYLVFMKIDFNNPQITLIQSRLEITQHGLSGDNRTDPSFDYAFNEFVNDGGYPLVFGNGHGSVRENPMMSGYSWKNIVYEYGILGVSTLILILIMLYFRVCNTTDKKIAALPFLTVFLASIYQRPYIFTPFYMTVFVCGISNCLLDYKGSLLKYNDPSE